MKSIAVTFWFLFYPHVFTFWKDLLKPVFNAIAKKGNLTFPDSTTSVTENSININNNNKMTNFSKVAAVRIKCLLNHSTNRGRKTKASLKVCKSSPIPPPGAPADPSCRPPAAPADSRCPPPAAVGGPLGRPSPEL